MDGSDDDLVFRCRQGETAAFGELVRRYQDRLYRTTNRLTDDVTEAQDLVQESFLAAYQRLDEFKGGDFFVWMLSLPLSRKRKIYRIGTNKAIEHQRGKWKPSSLE